MSKLTETQSAIIQSLKQEFLKSNQCEAPSSGLFNVQEIINKSTEEKRWKENIIAARLAHTKMVKEKVEEDIKLIQDELKQLNIEMTNNGACSIDFHVAGRHGGFYVRYFTSEYTMYDFNSLRESVDSKFKLKLKIDSYRDQTFETFEDMIKSNIFKQEIQRLYEQSLT
jgi:hypothetical protein